MANLPDNDPNFSGLLSLVECDTSGNILQTEGEDAETLVSVLLYFEQMAEKMGDALGFDALTEGRLIGKNVTAICLPRTGSTLGALVDSRAKIEPLIENLLPNR
jgi:hypothetical protein